MPDYDAPERLEALMGIAQTLERKITHLHEDLVFVEHNDFLFQLDPENIDAAGLRFNRATSGDEATRLMRGIEAAAGQYPGLKLAFIGRYELADPGDGNLELKFFDPAGE